MTETRWLDDTQQRAWRGMLGFINRGLPEIERTLKDHDLLSVQYAILVALSEAPQNTLRLSQLADFANVSQSRLTHRLKMLTERGDVVIEADHTDGRAKNATLTPGGLRRLESIAPLHVEDVQRIFFDHLDPDETEAFADGLAKIAGALCGDERFCTD